MRLSRANTFLNALSFTLTPYELNLPAKNVVRLVFLKIRKSNDIQLDREEDSGATTSPEI